MAAVPCPAFAASAERPTALIERLRRTLGAVEATTSLAGACAPPLALGIPAIDGALGGGLGCGSLHEVAAARETETAAATGFALALAVRWSLSLRGKPKGRPRPSSPYQRVHARPQRVEDAHHRAYGHAMELRRALVQPAEASAKAETPGRNVVWIAEDLSLAENGAPYGPGLDQAGIAPERLITVASSHGRDALWAMEEALRCRAVGVVIGEMRARHVDPVATRRLSLAAAAGNTLGLLLRTAPDDMPSAAATRWIVGAASSSPLSLSPKRGSDRWGVGPPRLALHLVRNRRGLLGAWIVEWNSVEQRFELAANPEPVAGAVLDRPYRAAIA
jgi:protein ImuA